MLDFASIGTNQVRLEASDLEGREQRQRRIGDPRLARPPHPVIAPDPAAATAVVVVRATCAIPVWLAYS